MALGSHHPYWGVSWGSRGATQTGKTVTGGLAGAAICVFLKMLKRDRNRDIFPKGCIFAPEK